MASKSREQFYYNLKRIKSEKSFKREQQIFPKNVKLKTGLTIQRINKNGVTKIEIIDE